MCAGKLIAVISGVSSGGTKSSKLVIIMSSHLHSFPNAGGKSDNPQVALILKPDTRSCPGISITSLPEDPLVQENNSTQIVPKPYTLKSPGWEYNSVKMKWIILLFIIILSIAVVSADVTELNEDCTGIGDWAVSPVSGWAIDSSECQSQQLSTNPGFMVRTVNLNGVDCCGLMEKIP